MKSDIKCWIMCLCWLILLQIVNGDCDLVSSIEYSALEDLYDSTNGDWWKWNRDEPIWFSTPNPCEPIPWQGLTCKDFGFVCSIDTITLFNYNLRGSLPDSIGNFKNLTVLELSSNHLMGTIPRSMGNLTHINNLLLSNNSMFGTIPETLYSLWNISTLSLDSNAFDGSLSSLISNLENLELLYLNLNQLMGTLPDELFGLQKLTLIDVHGNNFDGPIPRTVGNAQALLQLDLAYNALDGTLPPELGLLVKMRDFHAQENKLSGPIPEELYNCSSLVELILNHMPLSGTISESISKLTNLGYLYLQNTNISGTLPDFPASIRNLTLNNMHLNGSIPERIFSLPSVTSVELSSNRLTGTLPPNIGLCRTLRVFAADHNKLTGPLPVNFSSAERLSEIYLQNNYLNGTLPKELGLLESLYNLQLNNNDLSGSIPVEFYSITSLRNPDLSYNYINGSISDRIGNLVQLLSFIFYYNDITGTLPESIGNLTRMVSFECSNNLIDGYLPRSICKWRYLNEFYGQYNLFSGPIPDCVFTSLNVSTFEVYDNLLSSTLPAYFTNVHLSDFAVDFNYLSGPLPLRVSKNIAHFDVEFNDFTGTIAASFFEIGKFIVIGLESNYLTGNVPSTVALANNLNYFDIYENYLSGTMPYVGNMRSLATLYMDQNFLSGPLAFLNGSNQQYLTNIDISLNQFTGTLPDDIFRSAGLQTFASVQNCLEGSISETICNAKSLLVLALDGLHTSAPCRYNLLNGNYALQYHTPGTIPPCLFSMPNLQTLHLSGNGIGGSLPYDMSVSSTLTDVALSYNQLTGSIPYELQYNAFVNFDLSYNTFDGYLLSSISTIPPNSSVYLKVNRLSGRVPEALIDVMNISILNSNMFECQLNREQLPKHDSESFYYQCATSSLQHSMYVFVAFTAVGLGVCIFTVLLRQKWLKQNLLPFVRNALLNSVDYVLVITCAENKNIRLMSTFFNKLMTGVGLLTAVATVVLLPAYIGLSEHYSIFQNKYAWVVSSVFLSGTVPAVTLLVLYVVWSVLLYFLLYRLGWQFQTVDTWNNKRSTIAEVLQRRYKHYAGLTAIAIFNFTVVLVVNVTYVFLSTRLNAQMITLVQLMLATFKFVWNDMVVRNLTKFMHRYFSKAITLTLSEERSWNSRYLTFNSYMLLFNVIVIPSLATAFVSTECLYNVYEKPSDVDSTITFLSCSGYESVVAGIITPNCTSYVVESFVTSFLPPYIYRYQCASTLVTTYAVVYVYKFVLAAFLRPAAVLYFIRLFELSDPDSTVHKLLSPFVLKLKHSTPLGKSIRTYLFPSDQFNLRVIMYLSIFVTFGVMFPPLAIMICIAVVVQCYFTLITLGRFVSKQTDDTRSLVMSYLNQDVVNIGVMFMKTVYVIGGPASFFYAYFVFDTYGDAVGGRKALLMALPLFVFGLLCVIAFKLKVASNESTVSLKSDLDSVELSNRQSSILRSDDCTVSDLDIVNSANNPVHKCM